MLRLPTTRNACRRVRAVDNLCKHHLEHHASRMDGMPCYVALPLRLPNILLEVYVHRVAALFVVPRYCLLQNKPLDVCALTAG